MFTELLIIFAISISSVTYAFKHQFVGGSRFHRSSLFMYSVRITNGKKKTDFTVEVPAGKIILDTAESEGKVIPYSCRAGSCSSCIGIIKSGKVDQSSQIFLSDKQMDDGYVLTCVATPLSDLEIEVDVEEKFYNENPDMVQ